MVLIKNEGIPTGSVSIPAFSLPLHCTADHHHPLHARRVQREEVNRACVVVGVVVVAAGTQMYDKNNALWKKRQG